jgi:hypothetical protein
VPLEADEIAISELERGEIAISELERGALLPPEGNEEGGEEGGAGGERGEGRIRGEGGEAAVDGGMHGAAWAAPVLRYRAQRKRLWRVAEEVLRAHLAEQLD